MDQMDALDRQLASVVLRRVGPSAPVDDAAIFTAITASNQSPKWRFQSMFSATKFVVSGAIVALFGGFLLAGILGVHPDETGPAALTPSAEPYVVPSEIPDELESGVLDTPVGPARWVRVTDAPANPSLMGSVATENGFAVVDHWSNRLWHSPDLLSWTELPLPAEAESAGLLDRTGGSYWLAEDSLALWRSDDLDEWEPIGTTALSPGGPVGLFRPWGFGPPVEFNGDTLVPVHYLFVPDLVAYLGLPAEPDGGSYVSGGGGGWVFEQVESGVYRVLTTSNDVDSMPVIRFEETPDGLRVIDAVDRSTLRDLPGIDQASMEALLVAFGEKVTGRTLDQRRNAKLREWAVQRGIASSQLAIVDGNRLVSLEGTGRPDASLKLFETADDLALLEFRDDGRVGVRRSRDGIEWTPSVLATDAAGAIIETSSWHVGTDVIELDVAGDRVLRSSDGTTWEVSRQPTVNRTDLEEPGGYAEVLSGRRMGGMVTSLAVDDGVAETLRLYPADGERIDIDLRPLGIGTSFDDGSDDGFGRVISDRTVALSFGSPPYRGVGDYVILSFDELAE